MAVAARSGDGLVRRVFLLIGIAMALNVPSQAFSGAYSRLTEGCDNGEAAENPSTYEECLRYVSTVRDILEYWAQYQDLRACIPPGSVANGQLASVVDRSLREHPQVMHESAGALLAAELSNAFSCKR